MTKHLGGGKCGDLNHMIFHMVFQQNHPQGHQSSLIYNVSRVLVTRSARARARARARVGARVRARARKGVAGSTIRMYELPAGTL